MKKLFALFALSLSLITLTVSAAKASDTPASDDNLEIILKANGIISQDQSIVKVLKIQTELPESLRAQLADAAKSAAVIWGDTILEGDYYANEATQLESVEEVQTSDQQLIGYRLIYSAQAWETGKCAFDYQNLDTLKDCPAGRIVEIGFVTADLKQSIQEKAAEFVR